MCKFWKQGTCTDTNCKFAHTDNPPKVPAGAATIVPGMPARPRSRARTTTYTVELMGDTGAGRHLGSVQAFVNQGIPKEAITSVMRDTKFPVQFETGGGDQDGKQTIKIKNPNMKHDALMYMLETCPLALSVGQIVNESKLPFVWIPGSVPFFAQPKTLKWSCPLKHRIPASRVRQNVPMFDLEVTLAQGMPAGVAEEPSTSEPFVPVVDPQSVSVVAEPSTTGRRRRSACRDRA